MSLEVTAFFEDLITTDNRANKVAFNVTLHITITTKNLRKLGAAIFS